MQSKHQHNRATDQLGLGHLCNIQRYQLIQKGATCFHTQHLRGPRPMDEGRCQAAPTRHEGLGQQLESRLHINSFITNTIQYIVEQSPSFFPTFLSSHTSPPRIHHLLCSLLAVLSGSSWVVLQLPSLGGVGSGLSIASSGHTIH